MIKKSLLYVLSIINSIYPKSDKHILFLSYPDMTDNAFALFKYMIENNHTEYCFTWLLQEPNKIKQYKEMIKANIDIQNNDFEKIHFASKNSIQGFFRYIKSKYIFSTHGFFIGITIPINQIIVNLWHGMPLKAIAYLDKNNDGCYLAKYTFVIATSVLFKELMAKAFALPEEKVLLTGQPRCDLLIHQNNQDSLNKLNINKDKYKKIIFWAPTYRRAFGTNNIKDGSFIDGFPVVDLEKLSDFDQHLDRMNSFLLIKLHPMDVLNLKDFPIFSNIKIIKNEELLNINCQLYSLLSEIDILLTDYSSIYIDYLLTEKPIFFVTEDFLSYSNSRGFVFEDPLAYMPGEIISDYESLKQSLYKLIVKNEDLYVEDRKKINKQFNTVKNNFSEKLIGALKL